jgi:hypothetical protein
MTNRKETLELNIRSKDWSAKSFDELLGGLGVDDFVNLFELGEIYSDEALANDTEDNSWEMLVELTGCDEKKIPLGQGVNTTLLGIYWTIGARIQEDRWLRSLDAEKRQQLDEWVATLTNAQEALRAMPKEEKEKFIKRVTEL